jgi:glycosyltransferase involved in cell wall biosynthesis/uncharacterized membrane protein YbhN (UPF0104 family)
MTNDATTGRRRTGWGFWLRLAASTALIGYLLQQTQWQPLVEAVADFDRLAWLAALAIFLLAQVISSVRWRELACALGFTQTQRHFSRLYWEGMFFNLCLPSSIGGDVVKACRLGDDAGRRVLAAWSIVADRACGLAALVVIGLTALACRAFSWSLAATLLAGAALLGGALLGVTVLPRAFRRLLAACPSQHRLQRIAAPLLPYCDRPSILRRAIAWSMSVQLLGVASVATLGAALGLKLPPAAYFVAVPLVSLAMMLPLSVGGVGVREGGLAWALASYGVPTELAVLLGLLWFSISVAGGLMGGLIYLLGGRVAASDAAAPRSPAETAKPAPGIDVPRSQTDGGLNAAGGGSTISFVELGVMSVSVVVPVYNEQENIRPLYESLKPVLESLGRDYEIVAVDDGSTDGSLAELRRLAAADPALKIVQLRRNFGQTAAMDAGLRHACGEVIVTIDADLQNDPADIPMMLAKIDQGYDLVHGWRKNRHDSLLSRRIPSKIANWIIARATRFPVHDLGCTLKAMRRDVAADLRLYGEMHRFIPILAHWHGARCAEVVTRHHPRRFGQSKYGISRTLRVVLDLITVKYMVQYLASPMKLFGGIGLACGGLAGLAGAATIVMKLWQGIDMTGNPLLLLAVFAGMVAIQFFVLGMLGELGVRTYYESQQRRPYAVRELVNFEHPLTEHPAAAAPPLRRSA